MKKGLVSIVSVIVTIVSFHAEASFLDRFRASSKSAIEEVPEKTGSSLSPEFITEKTGACRQDRSRHQIFNRSPYFSEISSAIGVDRPEKFLENQIIERSINVMDQKYRSGAADVNPWSGDYWAIRSGGVAKRYADVDFPDVYGEWKEIFEYFLSKPASQVDPLLLSPAEKYDLLVADPQYTLTNANWENGKEYNDQYGKVAQWMGLCHGWAPASFMENRPSITKTVVPYGGGEEISFKPDDLKALLSLKWANGVNVTEDFRKPGTRFIGGRCDVKDPKTDPATGRIIDPACFDLNPGSWHIVMTNHFVKEKRPLIIDASYDYEVWNQPVKSYEYRYFNPKTLKESDTLSDAIVRLHSPSFKDKFAKYRNHNVAVSVVGIIMDVTYVVETSPEGRDVDSVDFDQTTTVTYHYDLELDKDDNIVGGEWYQNKHPDFVWMPIKKSIAMNREDVGVRTEAEALRIAPYASKQNIPLSYFLNKLKLEPE